MSVAIRVIPCLDVDGGRVVKGIKFANLCDAGDPVDLAHQYSKSGADELVFLDISASSQERETTREVVVSCAENVFIPLTVGGGVRSAADVDLLLRCGADKVSINTGAIAKPNVIDEIRARFGRQVLVLSVDARRDSAFPSGFVVTTHGGKISAELDALAWIKEATRRGAGEILLNSMDADGTAAGFDLELIRAVRSITALPLIASGGAGKEEDFVAAAKAGADAVLAASVFHYGNLTIGQVKDALERAGFEVRRVSQAV